MGVLFCRRWLTDVVDSTGLDIDGIYRVSGNLAVIQKLRYKADHGTVKCLIFCVKLLTSTLAFLLCFIPIAFPFIWCNLYRKWLRIGQRRFSIAAQELNEYRSAPLCVLMVTTPVLNRGTWPGRRPVGRRSCHHRSIEIIFPRASGTPVSFQPLQRFHCSHQ